MDILLVIALIDKGWSKFTFLMLFFLLCSVGIGLYYNGFSRHTITDFTNPAIFLLKCNIFAWIWEKFSLEKFIRYFSRVTLVLSLLFLPLVYFIVMRSANPRMAIAVPLEIPFSYHLLCQHWILLFITILIIFLYGQRAMLVGFIICCGVWLLQQKITRKIKFFGLIVLSMIIIFPFLKETPVFERVEKTYEQLFEQEGDLENLNSATAGRYDEISSIVREMRWDQYITGKGNGVAFTVETYRGLSYETRQSHFTPLSLTMKYGILFCFLMYAYMGWYLVKGYFEYRKKQLIFLGIVTFSLLFSLTQTLASYTLFASMIPLFIGYIKFKQSGMKDNDICG